MRSNISIGGSGNCALPGPNSSPRAQAKQILVIELVPPLRHAILSSSHQARLLREIWVVS